MEGGIIHPLSHKVFEFSARIAFLDGAAAQKIDVRQVNSLFRAPSVSRIRNVEQIRDDRIEVVLVGEKRGARLIIGGEEFTL